MCVNPRGTCASFISFMTCFRSKEKPPEVHLDTQLSVEILVYSLPYLNFASISNLRAVNRQLNTVCSKYLNAAFFKLKKDIESCIFEWYEELKIDGKAPSEIIINFGIDYIDYSRFRPTINKILFAHKLLLILILLRNGIFRYMFYRNYKSTKEQFVFIFGNCLDWATSKFNQAKHHSVTLKETACLNPHLTQHLDQIIAFYKRKIRPTRMSVEKYMRDKSEVEDSYMSRIPDVVMQVEMLFFATHSSHSLPREFETDLPYYGVNIRFGYEGYNRSEIFKRTMFYTNGEASRFYLDYIHGREATFHVILDPNLPEDCDCYKYGMIWVYFFYCCCGCCIACDALYDYCRRKNSTEKI